MDIKTLADLSKLADLCRKKGLHSIKVTPNSLEFTLSDNTPSKGRPRGKYAADIKDHIPIEDQLSEDEVLFWSSAGAN